MRLATASLQACFGCHNALLELGDDIIEILMQADLVYSPLVDTPDLEYADVTIVEGACANESNVDEVKSLRERSGALIAVGSCACYGGIPSLRNLYGLSEVLARYERTEANGELPRLLDWVQPVPAIVDVDAMIPGCPPTVETLKVALCAVIEGEEIPETPARNLCHECTRSHEKILNPQREFITDEVTTYVEIDRVDPEKCLLEQGILCMGPVTIEGCGGRCTTSNIPCRGCMGPLPNDLEQGAKLINTVATVLPAGALMVLEDIVGVGYRFSTGVSIIPSRKDGGSR